VHITYTSDTGSLSFWLVLYDSQLINHPRSMVNVLVECRLIVGKIMSADTWPKSLPKNQSICWPTFLGWYIGDKYISWVSVNLSVDMSTDTLAKCRSICPPIYCLWGAQITYDLLNLVNLAVWKCVKCHESKGCFAVFNMALSLDGVS